MLTLYSPDLRYLRQAEEAIPSGEPATLHSDWEAFEAASPDGSCSVALVPWLAVNRLAFRLARFKLHLPLHPIVVATSKDADNVRLLKDARPEEIVWIGELARTLWPAVQRATQHEVRVRVANAFRGAPHLDPLLREALASACRQDRPFLSVSDLASRIGCDRRTLWRHWRESLGPDAPLRLEDFLHWLLLLHATIRKRRHHGWAEVALELGVHEHTLGRHSMKLAGVALRDLEAMGVRELEDRFARHVVAPLLHLDRATPFETQPSPVG